LAYGSFEVAREVGLIGITEAAREIVPATTFADLHASIDGAMVYLEANDPSALEAALERTIELPIRGGTKSSRGDRFLLELAIPNFFFLHDARVRDLEEGRCSAGEGGFHGPIRTAAPVKPAQTRALQKVHPARRYKLPPLEESSL